MTKTCGEDLLRCFGCNRSMDGRSQEELWYLLIEEDELLYCDACVAQHNAKVEATGEAQKISIPYAPNGLVEYMAAKYGVEEIPW